MGIKHESALIPGRKVTLLAVRAGIGTEQALLS